MIFLGEESESSPMEEQHFASTLVVGLTYLMEAVVPLLPVLIGAKDGMFSVLTAGLMAIVVSMILSFLSGRDIKRRIVLNLIIITVAVSSSDGIGMLAK